jgi:hypothetical protein
VKSNVAERTSEIDWLKAAVEALGGVAEAAVKLDVSPRTIKRWLDRGLARVKLRRVVLLSELSGVELGNLAKQCVARKFKAAA